MQQLSINQISAVSGGFSSTFKWTALLISSHLLRTPTIFSPIKNIGGSVLNGAFNSGLSAFNQEFKPALSDSQSWGDLLQQNPEQPMGPIDECILKNCKISG